jgi:hypothetical protein
MVEAARKLAIYVDLLTLPTDARAEILGGTIELLPASLPRHANAQGALRRFVGGAFHDDDGFGGPGGWWIFVEVDRDGQARGHTVSRTAMKLSYRSVPRAHSRALLIVLATTSGGGWVRSTTNASTFSASSGRCQKRFIKHSSASPT